MITVQASTGWPGRVAVRFGAFQDDNDCLSINATLTPERCEEIAAQLLQEAQRAREILAAEQVAAMREDHGGTVPMDLGNGVLV